MASRCSRWSGPAYARYCGFLAAVLALVSQLALGAMVPPDDTAGRQLAALDAVSVLCTGNPAPAPRHRAPHHAADMALCPLDLALAMSGAVLLPFSALVPLPSSMSARRTWQRPPGCGPPPPTARVGAPRAPPVTA